MSKIILASGSPRRKELLSLLGLDFDIIPADISEEIDQSKPLRDEIEKLSYLKAYEIFKDHKDSIVIGSDTIVAINNKVLGKPMTKEKAKEMLQELSGNVHQVITAVSILSPSKSETFSTVSDVYFRELSKEEIENYSNDSEPLDKAGAYAIQGQARKFVSRIDGDYYSIIGLPICELSQRIKKYL